MRFGRRYDPAAVLEKIFNVHGWGDAWRNGIYDFVHYHSMIHEVLGVARGSATLRLGGNKGRTVKVAAGDVIIVPAGVGHECLKASTPIRRPAPTTSAATAFRSAIKAITSIRRVGAPKQHPLHGSRHPLW
jgi:uncharacterized protein YjlB